MSVATFQPIHQPGMFSTPKNSRPSTPLASATDNSNENEPQITTKATHTHHENIHNRQHTRQTNNNSRARDSSNSPPSNAEKVTESQRFLLRRSSSAMRVRELRDVLTKMTEESSDNDGREKEVPVSGSQKARLLVASQQCLVSRLQDLRHEMESMDNEVTRVRNDIVSSRRYFSAMTGINCGPEWPIHRQPQPDSAYTSPSHSFISRSTDISPYSSDNDYPSHHLHHHPHPSTTSSSSSSTSSYQSSNSNSKVNNEAFQQLQQFKDQQQEQQSRSRGNNGGLSRSDSCSSFTSWRSETEMAGLFPEDSRFVLESPQITPRTVRHRNSP